MPGDIMTPYENAMLILLMALGGEASNRQLHEAFGVTITGHSRLKLNALKYVESRQEQHGYRHRLADAGWARCGTPLDLHNPAARALSAALSSTMAALCRDLERNQRSLEMVFVPEPTTDTPDVDLVERIRDAYQTLAKQRGAWVTIADIRDAIGPASPVAVDVALRELERQPDVNMVPQANENGLTDRTRDAAVVIRSERRHFMVIGV